MGSNQQLSEYGRLPQDPYFPQSEPQGPTFLDTEACVCALQESPAGGSGAASWQCIGNQTKGVYLTNDGKWFNGINDVSGITNLPIHDASNPPDTNTPLTFNRNTQTLEPADLARLDVWDKACTGVNKTTFSGAFYRAAEQQSRGETPIDAAPCFREGAVPIQIQNVTSWNDRGCAEGFLCENNTVNSLPQFCPPLTICQKARLSGIVCASNDKNIGMGPFEPVVCQQGYYCPVEKEGREMIKCPKGSYCQPGASTPTPCSYGSSCPEGSQFERYIIPVAVLILVDILLVVGSLLLAFRGRLRRNSKLHQPHSNKYEKPGMLQRSNSSYYKQLSDEEDQETEQINSTPLARSETWTGFQAALEVPGARSGEDFALGLNPQLRAFVESMRKATATVDFGLSFQYTDLSFQPKGSSKPILQNVTGSIEAGSLTAVMGGSGAGKSTFVNVLMGKTINTGGQVSINNIPGKIKRYKKLIGYVPQDDVVLPELTVFENIVHSARIRLPRSWKDSEIVAHVDSIIDCLELSHVRDSLVGSVGKPVISGGQRKRVSIGMELAAAPMAIFLDEPTSGLDATAASSIMSTLRALARLGISVIVIIHQPRMEIFEMLDSLILLANGQIIYEGPGSEAKDFFEEVGFQFPQHANFGDIVTDIITGNGRQYKSRGDVSKETLIDHWRNSQRSIRARNRASSRVSSVSLNLSLNNLSNVGEQLRNNRESTRPIRHLIRRRGAPLYRQTILCLHRAFLQQYRSKAAFWAEMGLASIAGFLLGIAMSAKEGIYFTGLYYEPFDVLSVATDIASVPQLALLIAIAIGLVAGAPGVRVFSEELLLHRREAEAGHSRLAYFLAKMISSLPRMVVGCLHFSTILLILAVPIIDWGLAFVANLMYFYCVYGLASLVSMLVRREDAPLFATMIALIAGILSGAAPTLADVRGWGLEWLWRSSPGVWLAELYFGEMISPFQYLYDIHLAADATGFHLGGGWYNVLILLAIGTAYRLLAYIGLFAGKRLRL